MIRKICFIILFILTTITIKAFDGNLSVVEIKQDYLLNDIISIVNSTKVDDILNIDTSGFNYIFIRADHTPPHLSRYTYEDDTFGQFVDTINITDNEVFVMVYKRLYFAGYKYSFVVNNTVVYTNQWFMPWFNRIKHIFTYSFEHTFYSMYGDNCYHGLVWDFRIKNGKIINSYVGYISGEENIIYLYDTSTGEKKLQVKNLQKL